jgi:two-component system NarL family sensor kinase
VRLLGPRQARQARQARQGRRGAIADASEIRSALVRFLLVGLGSLIIVALPTIVLYNNIAEDFALKLAAQSGRNLATRVLAPQTTTAAIAGNTAALQRIDATVRARMADNSVTRIKIWDLTGRLIYSDEPALIGRRFPFDETAALLKASEKTLAKVSLLTEAENVFERSHHQLVEVYSLATAITGEQLVFEIYFPISLFNQAQHDLLLEMAPVALAALVVLNFAQLPSALRLAQHVQRNRQSRQRLLAHAVTAADHERRRLAQELHDDVIQDLSGVRYALSSLGAHLDPTNGPDLERLAMIVHRDVDVLRDMVTALYPRGLDPRSLAMSISDLANPLRSAGVHVEVDVDEELVLDETAAALVYRVARESLHNAQKHAQPRNVDIRLVRADSCTVLTVVDDGRGFDQTTDPPAGHVGLQLIRDTVAEAGGTLLLDSGTGRGTRVRLSLPEG